MSSGTSVAFGWSWHDAKSTAVSVTTSVNSNNDLSGTSANTVSSSFITSMAAIGAAIFVVMFCVLGLIFRYKMHRTRTLTNKLAYSANNTRS